MAGRKALSMYPAVKSIRKVSAAHTWPCAQHISVSERGKAGLFTRFLYSMQLQLSKLENHHGLSGSGCTVPLHHWHKWDGQFTTHERFPALAGCSRSTMTFDPRVNGANLNFLCLGSLPSFMVKHYSNVFPTAQFLSWKQRSHFCNAAVRPV